MKKLNGHNTATHAAIAAGPPRKPEPGKIVPQPADKAPFSPFPSKQAEQAPLRPARGDDDLMSEEPSVPDHG